MAATLGASPWTVSDGLLPLARRGLLTAAVLGFAHTVGEFGVVLMLGGSIPGETKVVSIAVYERVEALDFAAAHGMFLLVAFSFTVLFFVYGLNRNARPAP